MWKVRTVHLLLIAAIVWGAAGLNILMIGINAYQPYVSMINVLLSAAVFAVFGAFIFFPLVRKHTGRIASYTEKMQYFWKFFDLRSFVIMVIMMTLGIVLRNTPAVPRVFIAVFYTGLGAALLMAGVLFACSYVKNLGRAQP